MRGAGYRVASVVMAHAPVLGAVRTHYRRQVHRTPDVRMVPETLTAGARLLHYAVSDNEDAHGPGGPGTPPIWAVNIHGYLAGGRMYWRESARVAERTGWRVLNPSLPGFGGSEPLHWGEVSLSGLASEVDRVVRAVGAGPLVLLGHSMGGAVAFQYAHDHPDGVLGIVYRDGVATPAWKERNGGLALLVGLGAPEVAPLADLVGAVVLDVPDLFVGRLGSTVRSVLPDVRRTLAAAGRTLPVGSMLVSVDLRAEVEEVAGRGVPILAEWGCFDRVADSTTAAEFARHARTQVQWLPGGHSWMLARPQGQADVLAWLPAGRRFVAEVEARWWRWWEARSGGG